MNSNIRDTNLDYILNTDVVEDDTFCKCGKRMEIYHTSNHHDGSGIFYAKCECGKERNIPWNDTRAGINNPPWKNKKQ